MEGGTWLEVVERAFCSRDTLFLLGAGFRYGWLIRLLDGGEVHVFRVPRLLCWLCLHGIPFQSQWLQLTILANVLVL